MANRKTKDRNGKDDAKLEQSETAETATEDTNIEAETSAPEQTGSEAAESETTATAPETTDLEPAPEVIEDTAVAESSGSSFASTALMLLVLILVVAGLTLWGAPKLAPYLPGSVAQYLNPIPNTTKADIAELQSRLDIAEGKISEGPDTSALEAEIATLSARIVTLEGLNAAETAELAATAQQTAEAATAATEANAAEAEGLAGQISELGGQIDQVGGTVAGLEGELRALTAALAGQADDPDDVPVSVELKAAMQALQARVDTLAAATAVLPDLLDQDDAATFATKDDLGAAADDLAAGIDAAKAELSGQIAEVAAVAEAANAAGSDALDQAQTAVKGAAIRGAAATLVSRITGGLPYAGALAELEELSGVAAPEELNAAAEDGLADAGDLAAGFPDVARAAIEADRKATAGDTAGDQVASWFASQISSRPTVATEGEGTAAVLSRVEASLTSGDLPGALAETAALGDAAKQAMGGWLTGLSQRVGAEAVLDDYIKASGGAD